MSDGEVSSLQKQLRKKARKPFKTCYNCYEVQEGKIEGEIPDSCNDCKNFEDMIKIEDVLEVVKQHRADFEPAKKELLSLLEKRPKLESIDVECSRTLAVYGHWFQIFKPKFEAFVDGCVCKEELQKLTQDLVNRLQAEKINHDHYAKLKNQTLHKYKEGWVEALEWVLERLVALQNKDSSESPKGEGE